MPSGVVTHAAEFCGRCPPSTLFLRDVTSSYLEGQQNELAAPGCNRDGKRFRKQVVAGLLTGESGLEKRRVALDVDEAERGPTSS